MENEQYDIEKLAESNNRERKMSHDFDDDDDLGMDFFKTMEEVYKEIEQTNNSNTDNKKIKHIKTSDQILTKICGWLTKSEK